MQTKWLHSNILALLLTIPMMPSAALANNKEENHPVPMEDVQRFSNALNQIKKYYVKPVEDKELFDNAIQGMLSNLDPHSSYLNEEAFEDLQTATSGEFGGLGIEVTMEEGIVKVITPLVDTPAYTAGIKAGDYIIKLGEQSVQGISLKEAVNLMRGKPGTTLDLTVLRKGEDKPLTFTLIREVIKIKSVNSKLLDEHYGYIRLTHFQALTGKNLIQSVENLKQQSGGKLKGLILDLRNNPGGLLDAAIQVSDAFIHNDQKGKEEKIVYTEGRIPGSKFTALANPGDIMDNAPMVVLINNGSASASEIVAGALKDNKRAIILGTKSFGKGSVQTVLPLDEKRAIKLTTALYYTPSGHSIQAEGINPDIVVEEVTIPGAKNKAAFKGFSEANLKNHLGNGGEKKETPKSNNKPEDSQQLLHEDYQLYTALTILKGLVVAKR